MSKSKVLRDRKGKLIFRNKHRHQVKKVAKWSLLYFIVAIFAFMVVNI